MSRKTAAAPKRRLSLTDFVDIVSKKGRPKATKVRQVSTRDEYHPAHDYYRTTREKLIEHARGLVGDAHLDLFAASVPLNKQENVARIVSGYRRWRGRKRVRWFDPAVGPFIADGIEISVNPEMGVVVGGTSHVVKLYFKSEKLKKLDIDVIHHLMERTLRKQSPRGAVMCILDVRHGKLIVPTKKIPELGQMLRAEIAYIAQMWGPQRGP